MKHSRFSWVEKIIDQRLKSIPPCKITGMQTKKKITKKISERLVDTSMKKSKNAGKIPRNLLEAVENKLRAQGMDLDKRTDPVKTGIIPAASSAMLKTKRCPRCGKRKSIHSFGIRVMKGRRYAQSLCIECR